MYEVFECLRCCNVFSMTDEERIAFCKSGRSTITCPKCGCYGIEILTCIETSKIIKNVRSINPQ